MVEGVLTKRERGVIQTKGYAGKNFRGSQTFGGWKGGKEVIPKGKGLKLEGGSAGHRSGKCPTFLNTEEKTPLIQRRWRLIMQRKH